MFKLGLGKSMLDVGKDIADTMERCRDMSCVLQTWHLHIYQITEGLTTTSYHTIRLRDVRLCVPTTRRYDHARSLHVHERASVAHTTSKFDKQLSEGPHDPCFPLQMFPFPHPQNECFFLQPSNKGTGKKKKDSTAYLWKWKEREMTDDIDGLQVGRRWQKCKSQEKRWAPASDIAD